MIPKIIVFIIIVAAYTSQIYLAYTIGHKRGYIKGMHYAAIEIGKTLFNCLGKKEDNSGQQLTRGKENGSLEDI